MLSVEPDSRSIYKNMKYSYYYQLDNAIGRIML